MFAALALQESALEKLVVLGAVAVRTVKALWPPSLE
jgi:hypothetical protein